MCDAMRADKSGRLRRRAVLLLGALAYALLYALGSQVDARGSVQAEQVLPRFALAFPIALGVLALLFRAVLPRLGRGGERAEKPFRTPLAFAWLAACYGAMLLIHYPGSFMYDTQRQVFEIASGEYEMFHPLLHTLLIRACLSLHDVFGSFEKCAALYSVIQLTAVAACFAQVCAAVARMSGRRAAILWTLFFGLYPSHLAFASNCTKDGLFSAFFALFFALCFEEGITGCLSGPRRALRLLAGALACLLRNNMVYALAAWSICLLIAGKKTRRVLVCSVLSVALGCGVNGLLQRATDAKDGSVIEMFSVPIQQLARARLYAPECFSPEETALMDEVFVDALYGESDALYERYEPTLADPVKNYLDEALMKARFGELARMWLDVGRKCPGVYLDAFLNLALPLLYPYSQYRVAQPYIETGLQPGVVTAPFGQPPMTQPARFEGIRTWMYEHIYATGADDVPVIRWLFNTGFVFWNLLMIVLYALYAGEGRRFVLLLLPALLWGTYLLGPVMQGRYLYPFICILPLFAVSGRLRDCDMQRRT